jgi:hypothetical protein
LLVYIAERSDDVYGDEDPKLNLRYKGLITESARVFIIKDNYFHGSLEALTANKGDKVFSSNEPRKSGADV